MLRAAVSLTAARLAWQRFYSLEHYEVMMRRARVSGIPLGRIQRMALGFYGCYAVEGVHPLEGGLFRRKYRRERRESWRRESPWVFYPRYVWEQLSKTYRFARMYQRYRAVRLCVQDDPADDRYDDPALSHVVPAEAARPDPREHRTSESPATADDLPGAAHVPGGGIRDSAAPSRAQAARHPQGSTAS